MRCLRLIKEGHEYEAHGSELCICPDSNEIIRIADPVIMRDRIIMTDKELGTDFHGHRFNSEEAASSMIRAYINDDNSFEYSSVIPYVSEFKESFIKLSRIMNLYTSKNGMECSRIVPLKYLCEDCVLELQMIDGEGFSYYSNDDRYILIRPDGSLATDYEFFYVDSMLEALDKGNLKYRSEAV